MYYPILKEANPSYENLLPKGKRQAILMTAEFTMDGKSYRVVGTVKKTMFGKIRDYNFLDFIVVDEKGMIIEDLQLSKRIFYCFTTLSMMFMGDGQIQGSILMGPSYFLPVIKQYDEIIERIISTLRVTKEKYEKLFKDFYAFLVEQSKTDSEADTLARNLSPIITKAKNQEPMSVIDIEEYRKKLNRFIQITDQRVLLVLKNKDIFPFMKSVLDKCRIRKSLNIKAFTDEIQLMSQTVIGSMGAMQDTINKIRMEQNARLSTEQIIEFIEATKKRGTLVEDLTEKQFYKQWLYR